ILQVFHGQPASRGPRPPAGLLVPQRVLEEGKRAHGSLRFEVVDHPARTNLPPGRRPASRLLRGYRASETRPDKTFRRIRGATISWTAQAAPGRREAVYPTRHERELPCPRKTHSAS